MNCLYCGDCCLRMSPLAIGRCPLLQIDGSFFFCSDYANRPQQCRDHTFPYRDCPIGLEKLNISTPEMLSRRIDDGWEKIQKKRGG